MENGSQAGESKVTYQELQQDGSFRLRVIRGIVIDTDPNFLEIQRRDTVIKLSKQMVLKIESPRQEGAGNDSG